MVRSSHREYAYIGPKQATNLSPTQRQEFLKNIHASVTNYEFNDRSRKSNRRSRTHVYQGMDIAIQDPHFALEQCAALLE